MDAQAAASLRVCVHEDQVAGHGDLLLDTASGTVLKRSTQFEKRFYEELPAYLRPWVPGYSGCVELPNGHSAKEYIKLENLTLPFTHPSVMDVKIGKISWLPTMSPEKIAYAKSKTDSSPSVHVGFRITGMKRYDVKESKSVQKGKDWGKSMNVAGLRQGLAEFFHDGTSVRTDVLDYTIDKLQHLERELLTTLPYRFISSSILIIYESEGLPFRVDVRMIDFANSVHLDEVGFTEEEVGYMWGLKNFIQVLRELRSNIQ